MDRFDRIYRLYALQNASYIIARDGVHLRWGARREQIPMDEILWVHPAAELPAPVSLPRLRWPGAVLGLRHQSGILTGWKSNCLPGISRRT